MTATPIRNLLLMIDTVNQRHDAIDVADKRGELIHGDWAAASRVWSRQQQALSCAIIAEPPQNLEDVLTVLAELAARHDLIMEQGEDTTEHELRDLHEMTAVAVKNCALQLASQYQPEPALTGCQQSSLSWLSKQVAQWLPSMEGR